MGFDKLSAMKKLLVLLICCCCFYHLFAQPARDDSLQAIFRLTNKTLRRKILVLYIRNYFADVPRTQLETARQKLMAFLRAHNARDLEATGYFTEMLCRMKEGQYAAAEKALVPAIRVAARNNDPWLLYACYIHLGFLQGHNGNLPEAVESFRLAKLQADQLADADLQTIISVDISDIYYRNGLYQQALVYLEQAQQLATGNKQLLAHTGPVIYGNKTDIYFHFGRIDSLEKYRRLLNTFSDSDPRLYTIRKRCEYYMAMLRKDYTGAVAELGKLQGDPRFEFVVSDRQNLATALYEAGQLDSARQVALQLLADPDQLNHPEIKLMVYDLLGRIDREGAQYQQATTHFEQSLEQALQQINRLTQVDTIAARIRLDEQNNAYTRKVAGYRREQVWMALVIGSFLLSTVIAVLLYRQTRQKRRYEQLLYARQKEELSFIHSHEVRRHLSNILGIIRMIGHADDRHAEYIEAEEHLLHAAEDLDLAIRNVSDKLDR